MRIATLLSMAVLSLSVVACSKNKCSLKNDAEKAAFGTLADMTAGAFSCDVEGASGIAGMVDPGLRCEVGNANCVATMNAIHPSPATVKTVSAAYKTFLETAQYKVEEKPFKSKFMNGKDIEGVELRGKNGDKELSVRVVPFGTDMVETRTMLAALK